jgi:alpha-beta hydrolase superfamily lysophospholipase
VTTSCGNINLIHFPCVHDNNKTVLCIHGSYSDARIFNYIGTQLSENGFNVYSMDLLGHGKSDGMIGDLNFGDCLVSINEVIEKIKGGSQIFILAHSIGCTFALWYVHNYKGSIDGLILMAPYIRISSVKKRSVSEPNFLYFLYLISRRLLTPKTLVKMTDLFPKLIDIGGEELSRMLHDKNLNFYYSYRYIIDIIAYRNSRVRKLADIDDIPIHILHGKKDLIFFSAVSEAFFKILKSKNKKINLFDCDHWFYDAVSYNYSLSKYSEESRTQIIVTLKEWISTIKPSTSETK